jgi:hypothetical protein
MKRFIIVFLLLIGCISSTGLALSYDATPEKDAMLRAGGGPGSGLNYGITPQSFCGIAGGSEWVAGIQQWVLPGDLSGATVNSATITYDLYPFSGSGAIGVVAEVLGLTQSWLEGTCTGGDDAACSGASDLTFDGINNWATAFGDTDGVVYDTDAVSATYTEATPGTLTFDVTALVQQWADGSLANNGVKIKRANISGDGTIGVWNKEAGDSVGARLHIDYSLASPCMPYLQADLDGNCFVNFRDVALFAMDWMLSGPGLDGDLTENESVDEVDLYAFSLQWLACSDPTFGCLDNLMHIAGITGIRETDCVDPTAWKGDFEVTVNGRNDLPVDGATINYTLSGVHTATGSALTDGLGIATVATDCSDDAGSVTLTVDRISKSGHFYDYGINATDSSSVISGPLLIEFGQGSPDARMLAQNLTSFESYLPFDGLVIPVNRDIYAGRYNTTYIGGLHPQYWPVSTTAFRNIFVSWIDYYNTILDLQQIHAQAQKFKHNFVLLECYHPGLLWTNNEGFFMDWFDDNYWNVVENNIAALAKIAYMGGCEGIFFDTEEYGATDFWNVDALAAAYPSRPQDYASWRAKVKQRGQEFIEVVNNEFPGIKIILSFGSSMAWHANGAQPTSYTPGLVPDVIEGGLIPPFIDGMLLGADANTEIVDGNEPTYYYKTQSQFDKGNNIVLEWCKSFSEHPDLYAEKVRSAFGLFLTNTNPNKPSFTTQEATDSVRIGLTTSDRYVWVWNERVTFWIQGGPGGIPLVPDYAMVDSDDPADLTIPGTVDNAMRDDFSGMEQNMIDAVTTGKNQALGP